MVYMENIRHPRNTTASLISIALTLNLKRFSKRASYYLAIRFQRSSHTEAIDCDGTWEQSHGSESLTITQVTQLTCILGRWTVRGCNHPLLRTTVGYIVGYKLKGGVTPSPLHDIPGPLMHAHLAGSSGQWIS